MNWKVWTALGIALTVGGLMGTLYYIAGTPQYSLYQLRRAVDNGDRETFYRYFDEEKVIANAIERGVKGKIPAGPAMVSQKATQFLIPTSKAIIQEKIDERLSDPSSIPVKNMEIAEITYAYSSAFVTLENPQDGSTTKLTLEQQPDRHWKVIDLDLQSANISYSLQDARDRMEEMLPPVTPETKKPNPTDVPTIPRRIPGVQ